MKGTKIFNILACASLFFGLVACSSSSNKAEQTVAETNVREGVFEIDSFEYKHTYKMPRSSNFSFEIDYKITAPKKGESEAGDKIFKELTNIATSRYTLDFVEAAKSHADSLYHSYEEELIEYKDTMVYSDEFSITESYQDEKLYVSHSHFYSYTGGAHGYYGSKFHVFDSKTGDLCKLSNFFSDESKEKLKSMIIDYFVKENKLNNSSELVNVGFLDENEIDVTENFSIDDEGISFVYCPYEIACYASGIQTAYFTWSEVASLLKPDSPAAHFLK